MFIIPPRLVRGVVTAAANDNPEPPARRLARFGWIAAALVSAALIVILSLD